MKIEHILVPVDFSQFSEVVIHYAFQIALQYSARLTLFHAVILFQDDVDEEQRLDEYQQLLALREERIAVQMQHHLDNGIKKGIRISTVIQRGISPSDVILEYLNTNQVDIIVMGTHGRAGLRHLLLGSVAEKVGRFSAVPVLTVHRSIQNFQIKKLLVPIDFSPYSKQATEYAISLARNFNASITFLHVVEQEIFPPFYASGVESVFEIDPDLDKRVIENMNEFLSEQLDGHIETSYIVREGKSHKEIVDFAREDKSDIIVIASHGLTGLDYILLGSTTEKVIRWAKCPVLTVKRKS
ncbi:MAG TPA: universal stress protein [Caldithrix sp.]|nr:universal stress protein [Caldithrix sp.]